MTKTFSYTAFGFTLSAPFECGHLVKTDVAAPEVTVEYGKVPESLTQTEEAGLLWQVSNNEYLMSIPGIARYWVRDGKLVVIEPDAGSEEAEVRLFFLSACLGILALQRGNLALHASSIKTPNGAALFAGNSGAGKSTLLTAFLGKGYAMLGDDIAVLSFPDSGPPCVMPGFPWLKLWQDAAAQLNKPTEDLMRVRNEIEKFHLSCPDQFASEPAPLSVIYILKNLPYGSYGICNLSPVEKFKAVTAQTRAAYAISGMGLKAANFQQASRAAHSARVVSLEYCKDYGQFHELVDCIEQDFLRHP